MCQARTQLATLPQRRRTSSSTVWALGALRLISMAMMPNSKICTVAPDAYLQVAAGPQLEPFLEMQIAMAYNADVGPQRTGGAHQNAPEMPYVNTSLLDCSSVEDHVLQESRSHNFACQPFAHR